DHPTGRELVVAAELAAEKVTADIQVRRRKTADGRNNARRVVEVLLPPAACGLCAGVASGPREGWRRKRRDDRHSKIGAKGGDAQERNKGACKQRCFHDGSSEYPLHREPRIEKQCVVGAGADAGAAELGVPGVLEPQPHVEPRQSRREVLMNGMCAISAIQPLVFGLKLALPPKSSASGVPQLLKYCP